MLPGNPYKRDPLVEIWTNGFGGRGAGLVPKASIRNQA